jgi:hypothetical protein
MIPCIGWAGDGTTGRVRDGVDTGRAVALVLNKYESVSHTAVAVGRRFGSLAQHFLASSHVISDSWGASSSTGRSGLTFRSTTSGRKSAGSMWPKGISFAKIFHVLASG